jgi:pyruvate dehydrogenase E1 component alpha subunit
MSIETITFLNPQGQLASNPPAIADAVLVKGYKTMLLTRYFDERMITLQRQGIISFALSSRGEEACAVASAAALEPGDWMYPQYREAGIMFWRGETIQQFVHHMFCDGKDIILGRQMPNHFGSRELNVVTTSSPLGTKIPQAAGSAYAMKYLKEKNISICYFGEGSSSKGDFHTGLNFAAVRKVPAIFFCRNNQYAISTPCSRQFATDGVAPKGAAYNITTYRVDGNDFFAVYDVTAKARAACIAEKGPILIEAMTYRLGAHSTSDDPSAYRKEDEVKQWEQKDPITRLRSYLISKKLWSEQQEQQFLSQLKQEVDQAIQVAKETPPPPLESLIRDVYFETTPVLKQQLEEVKTSLATGADPHG